MIEESSLALLANVALDNRPKLTQKKVCRRGPESRAKTLKITQLNGENHAEITDLKCMPISYLLKIFVETFEDKKLRCSVYVCKYEEKYCCNTRFIDVKENKINRLEHLVRCHLLEHLTKTKTGSMIKLPKLVSTHGEIIPSIDKPKPSVKLKPNFKYEEIEWKSEEEKKINSDAVPVGKTQSKVVPLQELKVIKINDNIPKRSRTGGVVKKSESRPITADGSTQGSALRRIKFDHPYSNLSERSSNVTSGISSRYAIMPVEYQSVDVNNLYYLNGESSSELNSFMIHETLNQSASIMTTDDGEATSEQLPLVGCEAEVTTEEAENKRILSDECIPIADESYFPCSKCDIVLSSRQVLYSHMRNKHFDTTIFKPYKGSPKNRTVTAEPKTVKRKFEMLTEYRNNDFLEIVKENTADDVTKCVDGEESILKTALLKESNKKPVINISNVWNNINVQYV